MLFMIPLIQFKIFMLENVQKVVIVFNIAIVFVRSVYLFVIFDGIFALLQDF